MGWLLALACAGNVCAAQPELRIQFAEKVQLPARIGHVEFEAYGRRFAFDLESNDRLLASIPAARKAALPGARLMRGKLAGLAGSWVRLARVGNGLEGAIWDGSDLYVVTNAGAIEAALTTPLVAASTDTVLFRLSDAINGLPKGYCGVAPEAARSTSADVPALGHYKAMVAEIRTAATTAAVEQLRVALIADSAFQNREGSDSTEVMLARLNSVDGIFSEQVGVLLVPSEVRLVPQGSDPFTQTAPGDLLRQLSDYRRTNPAIRAAGLAHLLTGKDLDGNTVGIAYVDTLCDQQRGTTTIQCSMGFIAAGDARYFDISLNTSAAGTFTSNVSIQAANDSNAGNNASVIALSVTEPAVVPPPAPPPAPPPSSGGGSGGGGSFEWLAVIFLAWMALRRKLRTSATA